MIVTLMARGICWIDKVRDDCNSHGKRNMLDRQGKG